MDKIIVTIFLMYFVFHSWISANDIEEGRLFVRQQSLETCDCGQSNRAAKIIGGEVTRRHEYPWMFTIQMLGENGQVSIHETTGYFLLGAMKSQFCGGTIISKKWVISAAHCVIEYRTRPYMVTVAVGRHNLNSIFGIFMIPRIASAIRIHHDYNPRLQEFDVALIRVLLPVSVSARIGPICFPNFVDNDFTNKELVITGWGATSEGGDSSSQLQDVVVKGISNEECEKNYEPTGIPVTKNMVCAGLLEGGKDACQGDSGGPLIYKCGSHFSLVGIVSFGIGCAQPGYPGVYTRISILKDWVEAVVGVDGYCPYSCAEASLNIANYNGTILGNNPETNLI